MKRLIHLTRSSIRYRLLGAVLAPILGITVFASVYYPLEQRSLGIKGALHQVRTFSEMLAFSVGAGLSDGNFDLIQTAFDWATADSNVVYVAIVDEDGADIFEHNPRRITLDREALMRRDEVVQEEGLLKTATPIRYQGQALGHVLLAYSTEAFRHQFMSSVFVSVLVGLLLLAGGVGVVLFVTRISTRQIIALRDAAQAVAAGELHTHIEARGEDEVGDLARSFQKMVDAVGAANEALQAEKAAVEHKVEEAVRASEAEKRYLRERVEQMLVQMEAFASGDLSAHLDDARDDEIGRLYDGFNRAVANIRTMFEEVHRATDASTQAAVRISTSAQQMAAASQESSAETHEVAAAVEEMARTISENAANATRTAEVASQSGEVAAKGGDIVLKTVEKIRDIARVVQASAGTVEHLGQTSARIGDIVQVIDEIADQTNLLALNAAIEAARAGEQGRGFAVVADEVRKLAERTTTATKQIAEMIGAIQQETGRAVEAIQHGNDEVTEGIALADQAQEALQAIVSNVDEVVHMTTQIAAASEEQSVTSEEMSRSVERISLAAQHAAEGIQQIVAVANELNLRNDALRESVSRFSTHGASPAPRRPDREARERPPAAPAANRPAHPLR